MQFSCIAYHGQTYQDRYLIRDRFHQARTEVMD